MNAHGSVVEVQVLGEYHPDILHEVSSGQWSVVSGRWSVVSGQWSVVCGQWSVVCGQCFTSTTLTCVTNFLPLIR